MRKIEQDQGVPPSGSGHSGKPQAPSGLGHSASVPNADEGYEAIAISAHLPFHTIAFTFPREGIPFAGGVFRIQRVRTATEDDEARFPKGAPTGVCPLCGQDEPE